MDTLLGEIEMYRSRAQESFAYVFSSEHTTLARKTERPDLELRAELGGVDTSAASRAGATGLDVVQPPSRYTLSVLPPPMHDVARHHGHRSQHDQHDQRVRGGDEHGDGSRNEPVAKSKSCILQ